MARRAQDSERSGRRRRTSQSREQAEGVLRAAGNAKDAGAEGADSARQAGENAAGGAAGAGQGATAQAATEIAEGAMEATRNVATTAVDAAKATLTNGDGSKQEGLFRQVILAAREAAGEVLEREARSAAKQAAEVLTARAPEIAREQLDKRGGSNAAARAAVEFGRSKLQGAGGGKALTSAAVGAVKESAGELRTKVTDALSGGEADEDGGGTSRVPVEVAVDIGAPRDVVWDEWTRFEDSPSSLHRLQSSEDGTLKVSAKVWGSSKEEEAEIIEQVEEERLAWRAEGAIPYRGVVSLHALDDNLTRLLVTLEFEPQGLVARLGAGARSIQRGVEADIKRFKADLETRGEDDDGGRALPQGDGEEQAAAEGPGEPDEDMEEPVDAEVLDDADDIDDSDDIDDEAQDADVEEEDEEAEPEEDEEAEPEEDEETEAPAAARAKSDKTASRGGRGSRSRSAPRDTGTSQSRRGSSSGSSRSRSASSSSRSSGSRSGASGGAKAGSGKGTSARSSARKSQSGSSRSSGGSRRRSSSN